MSLLTNVIVWSDLSEWGGERKKSMMGCPMCATDSDYSSKMTKLMFAHIVQRIDFKLSQPAHHLESAHLREIDPQKLSFSKFQQRHIKYDSWTHQFGRKYRSSSPDTFNPIPRINNIFITPTAHVFGVCGCVSVCVCIGTCIFFWKFRNTTHTNYHREYDVCTTVDSLEQVFKKDLVFVFVLGIRSNLGPECRILSWLWW